MTGRRVRQGVVAGAVASLPSGVPSTVYALATGGDALEATKAAGRIIVQRGDAPPHRDGELVIAATPLHLAISMGWGVVMAMAPITWTPWKGAVAGLGIAAVDLGGFGRFFPSIRALKPAPQVADHVVFGVVVAAVLSRRPRRRGPANRALAGGTG